MPTTPTAARSRVTGIVLGVLLLAAVMVLAVLLPALGDSGTSQASESDGASGAGVEVTLPSQVDGFSLVQGDDGAAAADLAERLGSAEQVLEETYDVPVTVGLYEGEAASGQDGQGAAPAAPTAVVTAASVPAGLFLPSGPAPEPELVGLARNQTELVRVGGAVCNVQYAQPVAAGQEVDPDELPAGVQCQLTSDDVTFQVDGSGMSADQAAGLLEDLAAA